MHPEYLPAPRFTLFENLLYFETLRTLLHPHLNLLKRAISSPEPLLSLSCHILVLFDARRRSYPSSSRDHPPSRAIRRFPSENESVLLGRRRSFYLLILHAAA